MYRVVKSTTQKTQYHCEKCRYFKKHSKDPTGCYGECNAEDRVITRPFNCRDFYCVQYENPNEMNETKLKTIKEKTEQKRSVDEYKKWARKYHTKPEAEKLIAKWLKEKGIK